MPEPSPEALPALDPDAAAHAARVAAHLRGVIAAAGGAVPFARFMELALYAPGLGYYSAGAHKLGEAGDFVTAPELSPLFARALARPVAHTLRALGGGAVLELGPGTGSLAAGLLDALERADALPEHYLLLERSADLRARQQAALAARAPRLLARCRWLDRLPEPGFRGVVLANEVMDALPVSRFRIDARGGVREWWVRADGDRFAWHLDAPADPDLERAVRVIEAYLGRALAPGYEAELCPALGPWVAALGERLESGCALLLDYGYPRREYYHPERVRGTLRCYHRHRLLDDPLLRPGLQDITAHVDFTAVAEAAHGAGLTVAGFTTQAGFLLGNGLLDDLAALEPGTPVQVSAAAAVKRLILPGEMGELVKVMALCRGLAAPPPGLDRPDRLASL